MGIIKTLDLEEHVSLTSAETIDNIVRPLRDMFGIRFFRYLKLYKNGKRVILSNIPDAIRYMYGQGQYVNLWYDGEFPQFLKEGWHTWYLNRLLDTREIEIQIENELTSLLKVYHGITFVHEADHYFEIFSFDSAEKNIYQIDKRILTRFIFYFRQQARKLIAAGELDSLLLPIQNLLTPSPQAEMLITFLSNTKINRYYLRGHSENAYLTAKEAACVRWIIEGKTAEEISKLENIQVKTVQRHIEHIKEKFNCKKQTQIVQLIMNSGLLGALEL